MMGFKFYFKHMESSQALQAHAEARICEKTEKFLHKPAELHLIFEVSGKVHRAHGSLHGADGVHFEVEAVSEDMYESVDLLADKIVHQLKRFKEKLKDHKGHANVRSLAEFSERKNSQKQARKKDSSSSEFVDAEDILKYEAARRR